MEHHVKARETSWCSPSVTGPAEYAGPAKRYRVLCVRNNLVMGNLRHRNAQAAAAAILATMTLADAYKITLELQAQFGAETRAFVLEHLSRCIDERNFESLQSWSRVYQTVEELERQNATRH